MAKAAPVFYCVQGEDDIEHPNAFFVPRPEDGSRIGFEAFLQHFPFSRDSFHFRFQVPSPDGSDGYVWMDASPEKGGEVPNLNGRIFCKALRIGTRAMNPAAPRPQKKTPAPTPKPAPAAASPSSPSPAEDPFGPSTTTSSPPPDPFADPFAENPFSQAPGQTHVSTPTGSVGQPTDLKGSRLDDQIAHKIEMWRTKDGKEIGGTGIRNLLCTVHGVLWEGANWKEVPLRNLITPQDVKKNYQKAVRVVHPDRVSKQGPEDRLVAERIFEALNNAWRDCEAKEFGK